MPKIVSVLLIIWWGSVNAFADSERPFQSYAIETADKKYLFVMLKPDDSLKKLATQYPQSGLYLNDGSITPLWTVDWTGYVFLPPDGVHLIRRGPWPQTEDGYDVEALTFFAFGKPLRSYRVRDLVDFPWLLPESVSHYRWRQEHSTNPATNKVNFRLLDGSDSYEDDQGVVFGVRALTMEVETKNGERYVFDLQSGSILSAHRPVRITVLWGVAITLIIYLAHAWYKSTKSENAISASNWKLLLQSLLVMTLVALFFVVIIATVDSLPQSVSRKLSEFKNLEMLLEGSLRTILYLPFVVFHLEKVFGHRDLVWLIFLGSGMFWSAILFLAGKFHFLLVKLLRTVRFNYHSNKQTAE